LAITFCTIDNLATFTHTVVGVFPLGLIEEACFGSTTTIAVVGDVEGSLHLDVAAASGNGAHGSDKLGLEVVGNVVGCQGCALIDGMVDARIVKDVDGIRSGTDLGHPDNSIIWEDIEELSYILDHFVIRTILKDGDEVVHPNCLSYFLYLLDSLYLLLSKLDNYSDHFLFAFDYITNPTLHRDEVAY
jgi:hypothetical protein